MQVTGDTSNKQHDVIVSLFSSFNVNRRVSRCRRVRLWFDDARIPRDCCRRRRRHIIGRVSIVFDPDAAIDWANDVGI